MVGYVQVQIKKVAISKTQTLKKYLDRLKTERIRLVWANLDLVLGTAMRIRRCDNKIFQRRIGKKIQVPIGESHGAG